MANLNDNSGCSLYNEVKATQVACLLIKLNGGNSIDYAKCIKLLYSVEREALNRWTRPVIYDKLCSMPYGQVVSHTLDRAQGRVGSSGSYWTEHLRTEAKKYAKNKIIRLIKECGVEQLSRAEIELVKEVFNINKHKTTKRLFDEHHNPTLFPEYRDPHGGSIETKCTDLLGILGKTKEEIAEFEADMHELESLQELVH